MSINQLFHSKFKKIHISQSAVIVVILFFMLSIRIFLLAGEFYPFNSDEAIVGLMAIHINAGELPLFFYGQAYMGSLDAFFVALGFLLFGNHIITIRIVQTILFILNFFLVFYICRDNFDNPKIAYLALILLAIPSVNILLYTTVSLGGYGEALVIGNLVILLTIRILKERYNHFIWYLFVGFLFGLGLWANALTVIYSIPCGCYLLVSLIRNRQNKMIASRPISMISGVLVGSLPWWIYAAQIGFQPLISELMGSAVSVETLGYFGNIGQHIVNFLVFGTTVLVGLRPPWDFRFSAPLIAPIIGSFWALVYFDTFRNIFRNLKTNHVFVIFCGLFLTFLAGFIFTSFGVDPSGRYFLPLAIFQVIPAAYFLIAKIKRPFLILIILGTIFVNGLFGLRNAMKNPAQGITTQFYTATVIDHRYDDELIKFLDEHDQTRGYTNYWVSYPIIFRSSERIVLSPSLPYHLDLRYTDRDDRYKDYTKIVDQAQRIVYITTNNKLLDQKLTANFSKLAIIWKETQIGDYHVFYDLSKAVRPDELDIN